MEAGADPDRDGEERKGTRAIAPLAWTVDATDACWITPSVRVSCALAWPDALACGDPWPGHPEPTVWVATGRHAKSQKSAAEVVSREEGGGGDREMHPRRAYGEEAG